MKDGDKIIDKILGRKKNDLISRCARIFERFDPDQPSMEDIQDFPLSSFLAEVVGWDQLEDLFKKTKDEDLQDLIFFRLQNMTQYAAFAFGYVVGNMFDFPNPKIQKHVEAIRKALKEQNLLPYLPREKKGGSHEKESTHKGL